VTMTKQRQSVEFLLAALTACREAIDELAAQSHGYGSELAYQINAHIEKAQELADDYAHYARDTEV